MKIMYDDGIEEVEFPTPICPLIEPHARHRIPGTWRDECSGVQGPEIQHNATGDYSCTECGHQGNGQVPGCTCIGCDDTEIAAETARLMRAGWRNAGTMAASNVARRRTRSAAEDTRWPHPRHYPGRHRAPAA